MLDSRITVASYFYKMFKEITGYWFNMLIIRKKWSIFV